MTEWGLCDFYLSFFSHCAPSQDRREQTSTFVKLQRNASMSDISENDFERLENWANGVVEELRRFQTGINLRRPSDYQSMFKYISLNSETSWEYLKNTLCNSQLFGSPALGLNDPFELSPFVFDDLQASTIADAVKHKDYVDRLLAKKGIPLEAVTLPDTDDLEPYRRQARSYLDSVITQYRSSPSVRERTQVYCGHTMRTVTKALACTSSQKDSSGKEIIR